MGVLVQPFGEFEGRTVNKYTIVEEGGIRVSAINYGAALQSILVSDRDGLLGDVILGFDSLQGYFDAGSFYFGSICGRYANRIGGAKFRINGNEYRLVQNVGESSLHGGLKGFDKVYWDADVLADENGVIFTYTSRDGEEGYPGNLSVSVVYRVEGNSLHIAYNAITDITTPVNLTSHCYFNLSGGTDDTILDHELKLNSDMVIEVNDALVPTGQFLNVKGTLLDFNEGKKIGAAPDTEYDYSWVIKRAGQGLMEAAVLKHKKSGRSMTVCTTQPGIHFYSGNFLNGMLKHTKKGKGYVKHAGLCLETQHFADSPNQSGFPSAILKPGQVYSEKTIYSFNID